MTSLLSAVYIEFILGVQPCKLCVYQRIPYLVAIFISFLGYCFPKKNIFLYGMILVFFLSLLLSGYHVGIENNIFSEFAGCTSENLNITDKNKLLESLNNSLNNCKDIHFTIFGFSLATINFFISLAIVIISIITLKNEKN